MSAFDILAGTPGWSASWLPCTHRDETGAGQHVQVSLMMSALSGMNSHASAYLAGGVVPFRMGNGHPSLFPYEPLTTADGT